MKGADKDILIFLNTKIRIYYSIKSPINLLQPLVIFRQELTCAEKKLIPRIVSTGKDTLQPYPYTVLLVDYILSLWLLSLFYWFFIAPEASATTSHQLFSMKSNVKKNTPPLWSLTRDDPLLHFFLFTVCAIFLVLVV